MAGLLGAVVILFFINITLTHRLVLQSPKAAQYLPDLIGLRTSFVLLQVDSRVAGPRRPEYVMTSRDSRPPEKVLADRQKPRTPDVTLAALKLVNRLRNGHRGYGTAFGTVRKAGIGISATLWSVSEAGRRLDSLRYIRLDFRLGDDEDG